MDEQLSNEAVENLVTQFSSALDFYRELVQNAIDAGSGRVDVWTEFIEPTDGGAEGVIAIHVDDFGEGMDEAIIDDQLTRLFSSAKENDLTKIGKFGIGFVSVFALRPKAVLVHTGRAGEYWEVLFHEDRSFTKTRVDDPVEGTQITLFLEADYARYRDIVGGTRETLSRWCSFSDTEVSYEDRSPAPGDDRGLEPINEAFAAAGDCASQDQHPGTEIAIAYSAQPVYGYYNKGLALAVTSAGEDVMGSHASRFARISFRVKSVWLEHTLSRETVMRDDNFEKAMDLVRRAASGPLRGQLVDALLAATRTEAWSLAAADRYMRLLAHLAAEPDDMFDDERVVAQPLLRTVDGRAVSLQAVREACRRDDRVYVAAAPSPLTAALAEQGVPVLLSSRTPATEAAVGDATTRIVAGFLEATRGVLRGAMDWAFKIDAHAEIMSRIEHPERVLIAVDRDEASPAQRSELVSRANALLSRAKAGYGQVVLGRVRVAAEEAPMFVLGRSIAPLMARPPGSTYERGRFERPHALVNREHPHFRAIERTADRYPDMAAYFLAKSLLLAEDRALDKDEHLVDFATRGRREPK